MKVLKERLSLKGISAAGLAALLALAVACSSGIQQGTEPPSPTNETSIGQDQQPDQIPLIKGPLSADGLQAILATADLGVGLNRFAFVLTSSDGLIREPTVTVSPFVVAGDGSAGEMTQRAPAVFRPWPLGGRGLYTTQIVFDMPGSWGINIEVQAQDGSTRQARLFLEVEKTTSAPAVGEMAVKSKSKTVHDVETLRELTTGSLQDPDLYQVTIAEAAENGLPTVVVMASPAFCTNAVCGPQVEVLQQLKDNYKGQANFVHVDFYDNPEEIQGDLNKARFSPTVLEWNLPSTEWSFVVDREGNIYARFEGFATLEEIEEALQRVL